MELQELHRELTKAQEEQNFNDISDALYNLGDYYESIDDTHNMIKYYSDAIKYDNIDAMNDLADYYKKINDIPNMMECYLKAVKLNNIDAMMNLANYYEDINDIPKMIEYYLMAIGYGDSEAMFELALYYQKIDDIPKMMEYYLMAIENGNIDAAFNLGIYYQNNDNIQNKVDMIKYFLIVIRSDENYELFDNIFIVGKNHINYELMIEIIDIIKDKQVYIDMYRKNILEVICKFNYEEQSNIKTQLNIRTKQDVEIELKLKHYSKDAECYVCYRELKCIPYNWCNHYFCVECITRLTNEPCPYCRYE
jgi:TPR repeat protein